MRVGIIGAGAAGMAAAYALGKAGHQATVYEGAPFLGGRASTSEAGVGGRERANPTYSTADPDTGARSTNLAWAPKLRG